MKSIDAKTLRKVKKLLLSPGWKYDDAKREQIEEKDYFESIKFQVEGVEGIFYIPGTHFGLALLMKSNSSCFLFRCVTVCSRRLSAFPLCFLRSSLSQSAQHQTEGNNAKTSFHQGCT